MAWSAPGRQGKSLWSTGLDAPAWFRFPPAIVVDPRMVAEFGGGDEMESVFAHELGHHALAPGTRLDSLKIRHQLARTLVAAGATSVRDDDVAMMAAWLQILQDGGMDMTLAFRGLTGLDPQARYRLTMLEHPVGHHSSSVALSRGAVTLNGAALMAQGVALPPAFPQTIAVIEGTRL